LYTHVVTSFPKLYTSSFTV